MRGISLLSAALRPCSRLPWASWSAEKNIFHWDPRMQRGTVLIQRAPHECLLLVGNRVYGAAPKLAHLDSDPDSRISHEYPPAAVPTSVAAESEGVTTSRNGVRWHSTFQSVSPYQGLQWRHCGAVVEEMPHLP